MQQLVEQIEKTDFQSAKYKDAYSRINAIVIEGEQEAHENYLTLGELLPPNKEELIKLSKMESRHKRVLSPAGEIYLLTRIWNLPVSFSPPYIITFKSRLNNLNLKLSPVY